MSDSSYQQARVKFAPLVETETENREIMRRDGLDGALSDTKRKVARKSLLSAGKLKSVAVRMSLIASDPFLTSSSLTLSSSSSRTACSLPHSAQQSPTSPEQYQPATSVNSNFISNNRPVSILLTPFSSQEWQLAAAITDLMDSISLYPRLSSSSVPTLFPSEKPSQILISKASNVVGSVRKLTSALLRPVSGEDCDPICPETLKNLKNMKTQLHEMTVLALDKIKENMMTNQLQSHVTKRILFECLIDIANTANEMLEYASQQYRLARASLSFPDDIQTSDFGLEIAHALRSVEIEDDFSSNQNNNTRSLDGTEKNSIEPDGEGFAIPFEADDKSSMKCNLCTRSIDSETTGIRYMGNVYHQVCFVCVKCNGLVRNMTFLTCDNEPLCRFCSPRCSNCRKPILSDCFIALEKTFHVGCFKCVVCQGNIEPDEKFYRKSNGACCVSCMADPKESVFRKKWEPGMNTRFSTYLQTQFAPSPILPLKSNLRNSDDSKFPSPPISGAPSPVPLLRQRVIQGKDGFDRILDYSSGAPVPPIRSNNSTQKEITDLLSTSFQSQSIDSFSDSTQNSTLALTVSSSQSISSSHSEKNELDLRTLPGLLSINLGIDFLIQFCTEEYSVERIFFWMDVEQYRLLAEEHPKQALKYARLIHDKYVRPNAEMEVFLQPKALLDIESNLIAGRATVSMFDLAQRQAYLSLESEIFPAFIKSSTGQKYLSMIKHAFPNERFDMETITSGRDPDTLLSIEIVNFEKRLKPEKLYVYELSLKRIRDVFPGDFQSVPQMYRKRACPSIFRSYQDIQELHLALTRYFTEYRDQLPSLPGRNISLFVGNTRSGRRLIDQLNDYFASLFKLPNRVIQSMIMKEFLKPTLEDMENYEFQLRIDKFESSQDGPMTRIQQF